jgi:hypothetical protein
VTRRERDLRRLADALGWQLLGRTGSGHWKLRHSGSGAVAIASATPSDQRNLRNVEADLRRAERGQQGAEP